MSEIVPFGNGEFQLEIIPEGITFRVRAPGMAKALGYHSAKDMLRAVPVDEKGWETAPTPGGDQRVGYLTEKGFFRVTAQRQAARVTDPEIRDQVARFQSFVFGEVLPALRRGELIAAPKAANPAEVTRREMALMILAADDRADAEAAARQVAEQMIEVLQPKAAAADALSDVEGAMPIGAVANMFKIGRQKFFDLLREEKILQHDRRPYQQYADWFRVVTKYYRDSDGVKHPYYQSLVYPAGAVRLHILLTKRGHELRKPVFDSQLSLLDGGAA